MSKIGYIRVSTEHQETARQQEIMRDYVREGDRRVREYEITRGIAEPTSA